MGVMQSDMQPSPYLAALVHVLVRQHAPAALVVRLLDAQHARGGEVLVVGAHRG